MVAQPHPWTVGTGNRINDDFAARPARQSAEQHPRTDNSEVSSQYRQQCAGRTLTVATGAPVPRR